MNEQMIDEACERDYNVRAAIADHSDYFDRWTRRSEVFRASADARLALAYGDGEQQCLDLFSPPDSGTAPPLLMFIHGGYWQGLDKSFFSFIAEPLVAAGAAVAVVGYELCPAVRIADITRQIRQATAFLWTQADDLAIDRDRLFVMGHSAGGHLTAMLTATDWPTVDSILPVTLVRGGVSVSGLFDLTPLIHTSMNQNLGLDADAARAVSPVFMTPLGKGPLLLVVGGDESAGFHDQSNRLADAWGDRCRRLDIPDRHHLSVIEDMADADSTLFAAIEGMVFSNSKN